ncbi:conserved Plasmodium protein, unknown function [Plasmodium vivax]|nr:conserved Plasmodium protein, unknown function [Plasmodium vivax]
MDRRTVGLQRKRDPPEEEHQTDVLIVGANTGGLLLSLDLARKNVNHLVINSCDRNRKEVNAEDISEQYLLYPRTLEILQDLGILSEVLKRSLKLTGVSFYVGNKLINQTDKTFFQNCNGSTAYMLSINKTTLNNVLRRRLASISSHAVQDGTILWGLSQKGFSACTRGKGGRKHKGSAARMHAHLDHQQGGQNGKGRGTNGGGGTNGRRSRSDVKKMYTLPSLLKRRQGEASGHLGGEKKKKRNFTPRESQHSSTSSGSSGCSGCSDHNEKYTNWLDRYRVRSSSSDTGSSFSTPMHGDHSGNSTCEDGFFQGCSRSPLNRLPPEGHRRATPTAHVRLVKDTKGETKQHTGSYVEVPHDRNKPVCGMHSTAEPIEGKKSWRNGVFFGGERDKHGSVEKDAQDDSSGGKPTRDAPTRGSPTTDDRPKKPPHCSIRSKFIVGVDGRRSSIRKLANIKMEGKKNQPIEYISVDVCAKWNFSMSHYNLSLVQSEHGLATCFPILTDMRNIYEQNFYCNDEAFAHVIERTKEEYTFGRDPPQGGSSLRRGQSVGRTPRSFGGQPSEERGATSRAGQPGEARQPREPRQPHQPSESRQPHQPSESRQPHQPSESRQPHQPSESRQPCLLRNGLQGETAKEAPHQSGSGRGADPGGDEDPANLVTGATSEGDSRRESKENPRGAAQDEPVQAPIGKHPRDPQEGDQEGGQEESQEEGQEEGSTNWQRISHHPSAPPPCEGTPNLITPSGAHTGEPTENGTDRIESPSSGTSEFLSSGEPQNGYVERGDNQSGGDAPQGDTPRGGSDNSFFSEEVSIEEDSCGGGEDGAPEGHPCKHYHLRAKTDGGKWGESHVAGTDSGDPSKPSDENKVEGRDSSAWGSHSQESSDNTVGAKRHGESAIGGNPNDGDAFPKGEETKWANGHIGGGSLQSEERWGSPWEDGPERCATSGTPPKREHPPRSSRSSDPSMDPSSDNNANAFSDAVSNNSGCTAHRSSPLSIRRGGYNWHLTICRRAKKQPHEEAICLTKQTNKLNHMQVIHLIEKIFPNVKIFYMYNLKRGIHRGQMCQEFYKQGIILAGEANCLHNPMFSVSINLTVHDVYSIGWRLKYLLHYNSSPILVEAYQKERQYVSQKVLSWSSEIFFFFFLLNNFASSYFASFLNCCAKTISRLTSTGNLLDSFYKKTFLLQSDYYRLGLVHTSAKLTSRDFMCADRPRNCVLRCITLESNAYEQNDAVRLYDYLGGHTHTLLLCIRQMDCSRGCACRVGPPERCPLRINPFSSKGGEGSSPYGYSRDGYSHCGYYHRGYSHDADTFDKLSKIGRLTYSAMARGRRDSPLSILWVVCGGQKNEFARRHSIVSAGTDTNASITMNGNILSAILSTVCPQMMHRATLHSRDSPLNALLTKIRATNNLGRQTILYDFMGDFQKQLNIKLAAPCRFSDLCGSGSAMYIFVRPDMHITHMNYLNDENEVTAFVDYVYSFYG